MLHTACNENESKDIEVSRIRIIWVQQWWMTTTQPLTCERLLAGEFPYKEVSITDTAELRHWSDVLSGLRLERWEGAFTGDCRVCCLLHSKEDSVLSQISLWPTGLAFDDTVYKFDSTIVELIEPHLPSGYFGRSRSGSG